MLVLTRKCNQSIIIGDDVEVSVLSVMGEKVRIGIQAPQEIPVFRKEIYLEIHREDGVAEDGAAAEEAPSASLTSARPASASLVRWLEAVRRPCVSQAADRACGTSRP